MDRQEKQKENQSFKTRLSRPPYQAGPLLLAALFYVALFFALHPRVFNELTTSILGGSDADSGLYVWLVDQFHQAPREALQLQSGAFYPYSATRAWSDNFLLPSLAATTLQKIGLSSVLSYNCVVLFALILNGATVFLLSRSFAISNLLSLFCGAIFLNASYLAGNLGHPQLQYAFWLPLGWWTYRSSISPTVRYLLIGLAISSAFYSSVHHAVFLAVLIFSLVLRDVVSLLRSGNSLFSVTPRTLFFALMALLIGLIPVLPTLPHYLGVKETFGGRNLYESYYFAASVLSYLSYPPTSSLYGALSTLTHSEAYLGLGFIALLGSISIVLGHQFVAERRRSRFFIVLILSLCCLVLKSSALPASLYLACAASWIVLAVALLGTRGLPNYIQEILWIGAVFFVLSLGPIGNPVRHEPCFSPFAVAFSLIPGFDSIRAVSRFGVGVIVCEVLLLGLFLNRLRGVVPPLLASMAALLVGVVTIGENHLSQIPLDTPTKRPILIERNLFSNQTPAIVLPFADSLDTNGAIKSWSAFATLNVRYMNWFSGSTFPIVNGYSGQRTKLQDDLPKKLRDFPSRSALDALARICGLRQIFILPTNEVPSDDLKIKRTFEHLEQVDEDEAGNRLVRFDGFTKIISTDSDPFLIPQRTSTSSILLKSAACPVDITEWTKGSDGKLLRKPILNIEDPLPDQRIPITLPIQDTASPHIVSVDPRGCEVLVRCDIEP